MRELYLASNNQHKKKEFQRLFKGIDIILPSDMNIPFDVDETGGTYIENALLKAEALFKIVGRPVIADDSGLEVDALSGRPGINSSRYMGSASYEEKCRALLHEMEGIEDRSARFITALALITDGARKYIAEECCEGEIATEAAGTGGFGYDPIFFIREAGTISALLPEGGKDLYSHRGRAARVMNAIMRSIGLI